MTEPTFHTDLAYGVIATAVVVFAALFFIDAPYGRHVRGGWGPMLPAWLGWAVMESPSVLLFGYVYSQGAHAAEPVPALLAALWLTHYVHRAFIFPFRMRGAPKPMPASIAAMAITFNVINSYLNSRWISQLGAYPVTLLREPRLLAGVLIFALGMMLNIHSDSVLFSLRKPGESGYRVPVGGGYRWVSAPNYLGELVEWGGFALAAWSLAGLSFFVFTFANLAPRAVANHRWYVKTFPDYPKERRALLPWVW